MKFEAKDRLAQVIADLSSNYARECSREFEESAQECTAALKSPIEKLMAAALLYALKSKAWHAFLGGENTFAESVSFADYRLVVPVAYGVEIRPESPVDAYRADFLVRSAHWDGGYVFGAIECDGHDHHNLTKHQASHDRERDRRFQELGLLILRYPGSEIWRNPLRCAGDALGILELRAQDETALRWRGD